MSQLALPETYRFCILNTTGVAIASNTTPTVTGRRVRLDSNGFFSFESNVSTFFSLGTLTSIANGNYAVGSTLSNTLSDWTGGDYILSCFVSGGASGFVILMLELSLDAGVTWPTPASANNPGGGIILAQAAYGATTTLSTASTTQRIAFEL
jgi:hypothetical protein